MRDLPVGTRVDVWRINGCVTVRVRLPSGEIAEATRSTHLAARLAAIDKLKARA